MEEESKAKFVAASSSKCLTSTTITDRAYHHESHLLFDLLCDNTLACVLLSLDFLSAVRFAKRVHPNIQTRIFFGDRNDGLSTAEKKNFNTNSDLAHVWRKIYNRHNFAPPEPPLRLFSAIESTKSLETNDNTIMTSSSYSTTMNQIDYLAHCRYRRYLLRNLFRNSSKGSQAFSSKPSNSDTIKKNGGCFSLPDRYFSYRPVIHQKATRIISAPNSDVDDSSLDGEEENNQVFLRSPTGFPCDSFMLTSPSTSGELAYLDPFNGSIVIYANLKNNTFASTDEGVIEKMMFDTNSSPTTLAHDSSSNGNENESFDEQQMQQHLRRNEGRGEVKAGIEHEVVRSANRSRQLVKPKQVLFSVEDYFNVNLDDYFHSELLTSTNVLEDIDDRVEDNYQRRNDETMNNYSVDEDVILDWLGIDTHTILKPKGMNVNEEDMYDRSQIVVDCDDSNYEIRGVMIGAARFVDGNKDGVRLDDERICTEILGWKKALGDDLYNRKYICRVEGCPYFVDICASHSKVYVSYNSRDIQLVVGKHCMNNVDDCGSLRRRDILSRMDEIARSGDHADIEEDDSDDIILDENDMPIDGTSCIIVRYPFLFQDDVSFSMSEKVSKKKTTNKQPITAFPRAEQFIMCHHRVRCFAVDPTGDTLMVGTNKGTIEVWNTGIGTSNPNCLQSLDICHSLKIIQSTVFLSKQTEATTSEVATASSSLPFGPSSHDRCGRNDLDLGLDESPFHSLAQLNEVIGAASGPFHGPIVERMNVGDEEEQIHLAEESSSEELEEPGTALSLPQCKPWRKVQNIILPRHLPVGQCGFVALQHHRTEGTTLSLWQKPSLSDMALFASTSRNDFQLMTLINLPLSPTHKPQVSYDGKRLIVFGKDHIGCIILVYHVRNSSTVEVEDLNNAFFATVTTTTRVSSHCRFGEDSGGVINLTSGVNPPRVSYVNRIRHAGLGGLGYLDHMFMTCNERFVVVNTKAGYAFGGQKDWIDGLFIIDLDDNTNTATHYSN